MRRSQLRESVDLSRAEPAPKRQAAHREARRGNVELPPPPKTARPVPKPDAIDDLVSNATKKPRRRGRARTDG